MTPAVRPLSCVRPRRATKRGDNAPAPQGKGIVMRHMSVARAPRRVGLCLVLIGLAALAGCNRPAQDKPALQGAPAARSTTHAAVGKAGFVLASAGSDQRGTRTALVLRFNAPLASAQPFDRQLAVTGPNGEAVSGSWSLDD